MDHDDASGAIPPVPRRADGPGRAHWHRDVARLLMAASVFVRVAEAETFGRLAPTDIRLECVRIFKGQVGRGGRVAAWSSRRPAEDRESVQVASSIKCAESLRKPLQELVDVLYANRVPAMPKAPDRVEFVARPGGRPSTLLAIRNGLRPRKFRGLRRETCSVSNTLVALA